jgi:2-C-methyl-D-erythritol 4-phosphate cytidylyltransferase
MEKYVIIVAGGSGKRMGGEVPKQFLLVAGKPILMHTVEAFTRTSSDFKFILVLPEEHFSTWNALCNEYNFSVPMQMVAGGKERFFSVKNALDYVPNGALVAVHDGVRPFVSKDTINEAFEVAEKNGSAVPVIDEVDSLRRVSDGASQAVNRAEYKRVQTPQVFQSTILKKAYNQEFSSFFTDDASVVESISEKITLTSGNVENIKLTTPHELLLAEALVNGYK